MTKKSRCLECREENELEGISSYCGLCLPRIWMRSAAKAMGETWGV